MADHIPVEQLPYAKDLRTCLPYAESQLREKIYQAVGAASACWENLEGAGVFESNRAKKVGDDLVEDVLRITRLGEPSLGCATTDQLLKELKVRISLGHGGLDYSTVKENAHG